MYVWACREDPCRHRCPLLEKHIRSFVNEQKTGELRVSWVDGGGMKESRWQKSMGHFGGRVGKIRNTRCFSQKASSLGFLGINKMIRLKQKYGPSSKNETQTQNKQLYIFNKFSFY